MFKVLSISLVLFLSLSAQASRHQASSRFMYDGSQDKFIIIEDQWNDREVSARINLNFDQDSRYLGQGIEFIVTVYNNSISFKAVNSGTLAIIGHRRAFNSNQTQAQLTIEADYFIEFFNPPVTLNDTLKKEPENIRIEDNVLSFTVGKVLVPSKFEIHLLLQKQHWLKGEKVYFNRVLRLYEYELTDFGHDRTFIEVPLDTLLPNRAPKGKYYIESKVRYKKTNMVIFNDAYKAAISKQKSFFTRGKID